jgi:hypothetical protein
MTINDKIQQSTEGRNMLSVATTEVNTAKRTPTKKRPIVYDMPGILDRQEDVEAYLKDCGRDYEFDNRYTQVRGLFWLSSAAKKRLS